MDGENNGKTYEQMDDFRGFSHHFWAQHPYTKPFWPPYRDIHPNPHPQKSDGMVILKPEAHGTTNNQLNNPDNSLRRCWRIQHKEGTNRKCLEITVFAIKCQRLNFWSSFLPFLPLINGSPREKLPHIELETHGWEDDVPLSTEPWFSGSTLSFGGVHELTPARYWWYAIEAKCCMRLVS